MQPFVVPAENNQPSVGNGDRHFRHVVGNHSGGNAVKLTGARDSPHLCSQQLQAHLDQAMVQVREHDIVTANGERVVENNRPDLVGVRVFKTNRRKLPGAGERGKSENGTSRSRLGRETVLCRF